MAAWELIVAVLLVAGSLPWRRKNGAAAGRLKKQPCFGRG
jgi:hypothetical protein